MELDRFWLLPSEEVLGSRHHDHGDTLKASKPVLLFEKESVSSTPTRSYDVALDGQRFLIVSTNVAQDQAMWREYFGETLNIVLNWAEELKKKNTDR